MPPTERKAAPAAISTLPAISTWIRVMKKPYGVPTDFTEHFRLMTDIITVAFQADLTCIVTFVA